MRSAVVTLAFALALPASVSVETLAFAQKHAPDTTAQGPAINDPDVKITLADGTAFPARARAEYWKRHRWHRRRAKSLDALRAAGLFLRLMTTIPEPHLRRIYRREMATILRRRPDPGVLFICVIKCAMHYHHYSMSRQMVEERALVNTF